MGKANDSSFSSNKQYCGHAWTTEVMDQTRNDIEFVSDALHFLHRLTSCTCRFANGLLWLWRNRSELCNITCVRVGARAGATDTPFAKDTSLLHCRQLVVFIVNVGSCTSPDTPLDFGTLSRYCFREGALATCATYSRHPASM